MSSLPSHQDDRSLLARYHRDQDQAALEELTERYMPLARRLANRYRHTAEPIDDLVQVANMALLKALQRFDPSREVAFSSFAVPTILGELKRHFRDHSWSVHVPRDLQERAAAVNAAVDTLSKTLGRTPSPKEISAKLGLDLEQVLEGLEAAQAYNAGSLDAPQGREDGESATVGESVGSEDDGYEIVEYAASMESALGKMPARTREVLHLRFTEDLTQSQIAEKIGVSQMHVSRLIRGAVAELRESIGDSGD